MTDITTWIDEYHKGSRFGLNGKILIKKTSKYQEIIVIENEYYGKALMLDLSLIHISEPTRPY